MAWLLESVETWWLLTLVGAHLSLVEVLGFEAGLSVLRSVWFFAPAGLGAIDIGYLSALQTLGVPHAMAVTTAFLALKRGRELLWIALGYGWMALGRNRHPSPSRSRASPTTAVDVLPQASPRFTSRYLDAQAIDSPSGSLDAFQAP